MFATSSPDEFLLYIHTYMHTMMQLTGWNESGNESTREMK